MMKQNEATTMKRHMGMKAMSRVSNTFIYLIARPSLSAASGLLNR